MSPGLERWVQVRAQEQEQQLVLSRAHSGSHYRNDRRFFRRTVEFSAPCLIISMRHPYPVQRAAAPLLPIATDCIAIARSTCSIGWLPLSVSTCRFAQNRLLGWWGSRWSCISTATIAAALASVFFSATSTLSAWYLAHGWEPYCPAVLPQYLCQPRISDCAPT